MCKHHFILGLTGPTGSGKSTVAAIWRDLGATVLNADAYARAVVQPGEPCLRQLAEVFSDSILRSDGSLDRAALAAIVFADADKKRRLERITHPAICERMLRDAEAAIAGGATVVVLDSPLLFEAGQDALCTKTVAVLSDPQRRLERIIQRDGLTEAAARQRMQAQPDDDFYRCRADIVIQNDGTAEQLAEDAREVLSWR